MSVTTEVLGGREPDIVVMMIVVVGDRIAGAGKAKALFVEPGSIDRCDIGVGVAHLSLHSSPRSSEISSTTTPILVSTAAIQPIVVQWTLGQLGEGAAALVAAP